jgi:hypothetical protein
LISILEHNLFAGKTDPLLLFLRETVWKDERGFRIVLFDVER